MPLRASSGTVPCWDELFAEAQGQAGYFTTRDAAAHGIGTALLTYHLKAGKLLHAGRGVFRFAQFPPTPREELVPLWLWSDRQGVFSHETALSLHGLSDLAPTHVDLTLPAPWKKRRLRAPRGLMLHFADVPDSERTSWGPVPCSDIVRTLNDCAEVAIEEQYLEQAMREAFRRGRLLPADRERLHPSLRKWVPGARAVRH